MAEPTELTQQMFDEMSPEVRAELEKVREAIRRQTLGTPIVIVVEKTHEPKPG